MEFKLGTITDAPAMAATGTVLIDVREADEFAAGSIADAVNIPFSEFLERMDEIDSTRPVALFCRSGGHSAQAAQFLVEHGYDDVTNLDGGMLAR